MGNRKTVLKLVRDWKGALRNNNALLEILQRSYLICLNLPLLNINIISD